ncbi:MAG: phosphoribosylanthranilate isomerase [Solimicrobium sp.]|jgi:phosphoribosylanthranilate isomerase|nr:phosphoribosylanthranilate isomerase [Solimicrobium sp.]
MLSRIKFCGFNRKDDVYAAVQLDVHALGFVFYPESSRYVNANQARELIALVPPFISTVGLFVNATKEQVINIMNSAPVDLLQFHGDETPLQCNQIAEVVRRPYLRALRVKPGMTANDLLEYDAQYQASSPWFRNLLLDSYAENYGGSGKVFDWSIIPKELASRVVLSGGLTMHNVKDAISRLHPCAVDVSSGIEHSKGVKDPCKMHDFIKAVKLANALPHVPLPENNNEF